MWTSETLIIAEIQKEQLWLVAGFILLGWVLARRHVRMRQQVNRNSRAAHRELTRIRTASQPAAPLCDAPVETQRWQTAMFDLQRELKAELDTRIAIVQSLCRQADQKIARLESLQHSSSGSAVPGAGYEQLISDLVRSGHDATEIASKIGIPVGDVELTIATLNTHT